MNKVKKYLPVTILFTDSSSKNRNDINLYFKTAFLSKKIEYVSNTNAKDIAEAELRRVSEEFYRTRGTANFEMLKAYLGQNMYYAINQINLNLSIDSNDIVKGIVKWQNFPQPFNMDIFKKPKTITYDFTNLNKDPMHLAQVCKHIADSIISSGILLKED